MPIPQKYQAVFTENKIYHVYNRTSNNEKLFLNDENHAFFLKQYGKYISPVADTFCWNLLPNHFHFLLRIKTTEEIKTMLNQKVSNLSKVGNLATLNKTETRFLNNEITLDELVEFYFKSLFQSYALAFNKVYDRKGNLFYKPFKRVEVKQESHYTQTIIYIHANAQRHKLCRSFMEWRWSSWHSILSEASTQLKRNEVLDWFGGKDRMIQTHNEMVAYYYSCEHEIEE